MLTLLLAAQIVWSGPTLTPDEAARILADSPGLSNRTHEPPAPTASDGPRIFISRSSPTAGPYGEFPPLTPTRPLDRSWPWWQPWWAPAYNGNPFFSGELGSPVRPVGTRSRAARSFRTETRGAAATSRPHAAGVSRQRR